MLKEVDVLRELSEVRLKMGQRVVPMIVLFTNKDEVIPILTDWKDKQEKYAMIKAVADIARRKRATSCSFVSEMWFATPPKGEKVDLSTPVSNREDKKEGVLVSIKEASGVEVTKTYEIIDEGGSKSLKELNFGKSGYDNYLLSDLHRAIDWNVS
jgi:hypothetical protein